ncbi:hypothetical protein [Micromonospora echinospora]|uniref:hypothetical protein n=1 Tax=Micromonospora echinospora TaxID=1877 RepID=UPI003A85510D
MTVEHTMSPTGVVIVLLLAVIVDYMSIGPNSIRDRIAFVLAVPAIREGFDGSPLDQGTVGALRDIIRALLDSTGDAYIAGASINAVIGFLIALLWIYALGCLLPVKSSKKLGRFATLSFPQSPLYRLNLRMWLVAIPLGLMSDLPEGFIGQVTRMLLDVTTKLIVPLPAFLFGAA